jgi:hypothetical protein
MPVERHGDLSPVVGRRDMPVPVRVALPPHLIEGVAEFACLVMGQPQVHVGHGFARLALDPHVAIMPEHRRSVLHISSALNAADREFLLGRARVMQLRG